MTITPSSQYLTRRLFHSSRRFWLAPSICPSSATIQISSTCQRTRLSHHHLALSTRPVSSSAGEATIPRDGTSTTSTATKTQPWTRTGPQTPRPLFPWRSEGVDNLVPRAMPGTKESQTLVSIPSSDKFVAWYFLNQSFWSSFISQQWKQDLEQGMTYAFTRAVAGIVSNVYRIPMEQVFETDTGSDEDHSAIAVDFSYPPPAETENDESNDDSYCSHTIADMMSPELRQLFRSAHESGVHQLRIRLQVIPTQTYFHRLYCLPFLTRSYVQENNSSILQDAFLVDQENYSNNDDDDNTSSNRNANNKNKKKKFHFDMNTLYNISMTLMHHQMSNPSSHASRSESGMPMLESTVAAEVMIVCQEIFTVWDAETGQVLQGYDDTNPEDGSSRPLYREVAHLVTFEQTTQTQEGTSRYIPSIINTPGNWQITDIDDLLGPQKWFHVVLPQQEEDNKSEHQDDDRGSSSSP